MSIYIWSRSSSWYLHWERSFGAEECLVSLPPKFPGTNLIYTKCCSDMCAVGGHSWGQSIRSSPCELYPSSLVTSVQSSHIKLFGPQRYSVRCNSLLFLTIWKYTWLLCVIHWQTFPCIWKLAHLWCLIGICHAFEVNILESIAEQRVFNHTVMSVL